MTKWTPEFKREYGRAWREANKERCKFLRSRRTARARATRVSRKRFPPEVVEQIRTGRMAGVAAAAVAQRLGCTAETVRRIRREADPAKLEARRANRREYAKRVAERKQLLAS